MSAIEVQSSVREFSCGLGVLELSWAASTHQGNRRQCNEDSFCDVGPVFAVADGMGGHQSGDVASALAAEVLRELSAEGFVTADSVRRSVSRANSTIYDHATAAGVSMGTTVTGFALLHDEGAIFAVFNVGDSRTYCLDQAGLRQVTTDHSHVQELIDAGEITVEESSVRPDRNIVTRALGVEDSVDVDVYTTAARTGQRWLSCSDGLSGELTPEEIESLLRSGTPAEAALALMTATLERPARDNVTVIIVDVGETQFCAPSVSQGETTQPNHRMTRPVEQVAASVVATSLDPPPVHGGLIDDVPIDRPATSPPPPPIVEVIDSVPVSPPDESESQR